LPSFNSFDIDLLIYPKCRGIQKLAGIRMWDNNMNINLGVLGEFLVVAKPQ